MLTERNINCETVKALRKKLNLSQTAFWGPVGVLQSVGCRYEVDVKIPKSVRILLVTRYVAGLVLDTESEQGISEIARLAELQTLRSEVLRQTLATAAEHINKAQASLGKL